MSIAKKCKVDDCEYTGVNFRRKLCPRHYLEWLNNNTTIRNSERLKPRPAIIEGDIAKIPLGVDAKNGYAIVDKEFASLDKHKWTTCNYGYALTGSSSNRKKLHHLIIGKPPKGMVTDHINQNKLDNRACNLRHVTYHVNNTNVSLKSNNKSGYVNVYWDKRAGKWTGQVKRYGKSKHLGHFHDIQDAVKARDEYISTLL